MLAKEEVLEKASRQLDDPFIESNIVLKGALLNTYSFTSIDDANKTLEKMCSDKLCFARIYVEEPFEATLSIYVNRGTIVAAILKASGTTVYGSKAVMDERLSKASRLRMVLYGVDPELLGSIASSVLDYFRKASEPRAPSTSIATGVAKAIAKTVAEKSVSVETSAASPPAQGLSMVQTRKMVLDDVKRIGLPVMDLTIAEGERYMTVDVICDRGKPLYSPEEVGLVVLRKLFQYSRQEKDIRLSVHHRKTFAKTYEASRKRMWITLGIAPEYILVKFKGNLRVEDIKYKEKKGVLEVSIVLRKETLYSVANVQELARELYEEMRKEWGDNLRVKVRIGRFGLEGRAP